MWTCGECDMTFGFESIEFHLYSAHVKRTVGSVKVYNCGQCLYSAESFEAIGAHCITLCHDPTAVTKGRDYDTYERHLFSALLNIISTSPTSLLSASPTLNLTSIKTEGPSLSKLLLTSCPSLSTQKNAVQHQMLGSVPYNNDNLLLNETPEKCATDVQLLTENSTMTLSDSLIGIHFSDEPQQDAAGAQDETYEFSTSSDATDGLESFSSFSSQEDQEPSVSNIDSSLNQSNASKKSAGALLEKKKEEESAGETEYERKFQTVLKKICKSANSTIRVSPHCPKCPLLTFSTASEMVQHKRTVHAGDKPFKCAVCGAAFRRRHLLKAHFRLHTGEKPFSCQVCDKTFAQRTNLRTHLRTHTEERPYVCNDCEAGFAAKCTLMTHVRAIHRTSTVPTLASSR